MEVDLQAVTAISSMQGHVADPASGPLEVKFANADPTSRALQQTPSDNLCGTIVSNCMHALFFPNLSRKHQAVWCSGAFRHPYLGLSRGNVCYYGVMFVHCMASC